MNERKLHIFPQSSMQNVINEVLLQSFTTGTTLHNEVQFKKHSLLGTSSTITIAKSYIHKRNKVLSYETYSFALNF